MILFSWARMLSDFERMAKSLASSLVLFIFQLPSKIFALMIYDLFLNDINAWQRSFIFNHF